MTLLLLSLLACTGTSSSKPGDDPDGGARDGGASDGGSAGLPTLTVEDGFGGGSYAPGTRVQVWADVDPHAEIVTGWTGEVALLEDPLEWNSALLMPDHDVLLSPSRVTVPLKAETRTVSLASAAREITVYRPATPVGIVLFFHGARYNRTELFDAAAASVTMRLLQAGYLVVALDSEAATSAGSGGWVDQEGSTDLLNVAALASLLRAELGELPVVAWGMSSGGQFAHRVGLSLPAQAVLASCAPGSSEIAAATTAATAWFLAEADPTFPTGATDAAAFAKALAARGIPAQVHVHPVTPLYDARFTRVPGIDATRSATIAAELRADGLVSESVADLDAATVTAIGAEIEIMAAEHELYDDYGARMLAFLESLP